ncbi:hypothetical protein HDU98_005612, partial [Podochytrium sp. JEL0797]
MIQQGSVMAPLEWRIFWDTLLCIIEDETIGYKLKVQEIRRLEEGRVEGDSLEVSVTAAAFVDDSNTAAETREDFAQQMQIMYDFQFYNTVESNVSKMAIIAVNAPNAPQTMKWPNGDDIKVKTGSEGERLLGNWFSGNNEGKLGHKMIENTINDTCRRLETKTITDKTAIYILNRVLLPKVLYMAKTLAITRAQMDLWYVKAVKLAKQKAGLAKSTATSILEHPIAYGLENWRRAQSVELISNLQVWMCEDSLLGDVMRIRMLQLQNYLALPYCPFENPFPTKVKKGTHFLASILDMCAETGTVVRPIEKYTNQGATRRFTIAGGKTSVFEAVGNHEVYNNARQQLAKHGILFLEQLMDANSEKILSKNDLWRRFKGGRDGFTELNKLCVSLNRQEPDGGRRFEQFNVNKPNEFANGQLTRVVRGPQPNEFMRATRGGQL